MKGFSPLSHYSMEQAGEEVGNIYDVPQNSLRKYLLGSLGDQAEMRRIEESLMLSDEFAGRLEMAEDELIEEYLDGELTSAESKHFEEFFITSSPRRLENLKLVKNLRRYAANSAPQETPKPFLETNRFFLWRNLFASYTPRLALLVIIIGAGAFGIWRIGFYQSDVDQGLAELKIAYRLSRPFESRLSNLDYAPFSDTRGDDGGGEKPSAETVARDSAARKLLDAVQKTPNAKSFHALGNYYLTEKQFDKAIAQFEAALQLDPQNARTYNDYGVAFLERAKQTVPEDQPGKRLENLARAYENFTKASDLDGSLLEAFFNQAIALQEMNLPEQAKKAWRSYLEKDPSSPWADEARRNLQQLETRVISAKTPQQVLADFFEAVDRKDEARVWQIISQSKEMITGTMIFFQLTRNYLAADGDGETGAAEKHLAAIELVGKMEQARAADPYFTQLANFYVSSDSFSRRTLRQAQNRMQQGYQLAQNSKYTEAIAVFQEAENLFARTGNVWESRLCDYWLGLLYDRTGNWEAEARTFTALREYGERNKYKWLTAQSLGWLAEAAFAENEYSKGFELLNTALKITEEISDTYNRQKVLTRSGYYYSRLGELQKALGQIEDSFAAERNYFSSDRQAWRNCLFAAETLYQVKLFNSAIAFGQEALEIGKARITEVSADHTSFYTLALLYAGARKYTEALDYAQKSLLAVNNLENKDKKVLTDFSLLRMAHIYRQSGDCQTGLKIYETVIEENAAPQGTAANELNDYEARKGRLLCYFADNQTNLIEEELPRVLNLYEKFRRQIKEEQTRNLFFDNEQSVYDLAVGFEYARNDLRAVFLTEETSKARSLLSLFSEKNEIDNHGRALTARLTRSAQPLSLEEFQQRLPENVQMVQYAVLPDKILIWAVTRGQISTVERKISAGELPEKVESFRRSIAAAKFEGIPPADAAELYDILISPILPFLDPDKTISFVPDKSLYRLPFAALMNPVSWRFLIEDFTLFIAPSATMLILSSEAATAMAFTDREEKILSVGNPHFDKRLHQGLADLPDAEKEAVQIAAFYQNARLSIGAAADKETVLSELPQHNIFHFAGHYTVNDTAPMFSKLLLARQSKNKPLAEADVGVGEILDRNLNPVKLAVLSACDTGAEHYYGGEGMIGIARAFLAGGVPLVVASQWAVDSDASAELMVKFHFYRRQDGLSSAKALRRAQLEMLEADSNQRFRLPYYWAGFVPIGGDTAY